MAKGTIIYMGIFELPDKNAAAHRVINNGKIFTALGYRTVFLGTVKGESFSGVRQSDYDENICEEAYPLGTKSWVKHIFDTKNIEAVAEKFPDTCLIITYNVAFATYKAVKKAFAKRNIKVAYDCTEWNDFTTGALPKRLYKKYDEKQIRTKLHKNCDDIIVISTMMERQYSGKNLLRLPPLVDIDDPIWHQNKIDHSDIYEFYFAGTIGVKEKVDSIVNAFSKLEADNVRLKIVGITKEEYLGLYPEQNTEIDKRIIFMGRMSHKAAIQHLLSTDCYIFIRERTRQNQAGFPTKFVEATTCGVPIVTTNVSDIKQYMESDVALFDNADEATVLSAMKQALQTGKQDNTLNKQFDYHNYLKETERWLSHL